MSSSPPAIGTDDIAPGSVPPDGKRKPQATRLDRAEQKFSAHFAVLQEEIRPTIQEVKGEIREWVAAAREEFQPGFREAKQEVTAFLAMAIEPVERVARPGFAAIGRRYGPSLRGWKEQIATSLSAIDDRYQAWVQRHIDPLLGGSKRSQLQALLNGETSTLRPDERLANRRLGLGLLAASLAVVGNYLYPAVMPVVIVIGLLASSAKYPHAWREWKETRRIGAIHLICVYSLYLWLGGYASAGSLGVVLYGIMLKAKALGENQSRSNLASLFQLRPATVWARIDGLETEIPFDQLRIGDTLVARAGQVIPVDGTILAGEATVDQHMLTGESQPVEKGVGDGVLASTLLISGQVDVTVEKTSLETTAGQITAILNRTAQNTKPVSVSAVAAADWLALPTLGLSLASWPFIGTAGAVSLIGANTTTASYLSSSLAMLTFLNLAARRRILVKEASALERLGGVDAIVFDKTGTLTMEQPHVARIHPLDDRDEGAILALAAAAEARQTHPIARAILAAAAERGLALPEVDHAHYEVGYGIKVRLVSRVADAANGDGAEQHVVRVGSARFMAMEGTPVTERVQELAASCHSLGHSLVMVAVDDSLAGCLELQPTVRPEATALIEGMRKRGLELYIISGDQEAPTEKLARDLGMTGYFANVLPEGKSVLVEKLQSGGRRVCFIGDGINDAIAMRRAAVSISLRGATTVATDTAQIILMEGNLSQLLHLFELATEFKQNLKLNIRFTSAVSIVAVSGILFAGFTFFATEIFYSVGLLGGLSIALKPWLDHRLSDPAHESIYRHGTEGKGHSVHAQK